MNIVSHALPCPHGETIVITEAPENDTPIATVIIVPGTPQTRVGAHRQFVILARKLVERGFKTVRFDRVGFGDSDGPTPPFEAEYADLQAVVKHAKELAAEHSEIWLLGLCDGASQAALYAQKALGIQGMILLNPWLADSSQAMQAAPRQYYGERLRKPSHFVKWLSNPSRWWRTFLDIVRSSKARSNAPLGELAARILTAITEATLPTMVLLSANDRTALEFKQALVTHETNSQKGERLIIREMEGADHTFTNKDQELLQQVLAALSSYQD